MTLAPSPAQSENAALQLVVFGLVASAFLTIYVTQPVLPVLRSEFGVGAGTASLTVSAVVFGIALANLPFGVVADRFPIVPIVLLGGTVAAAASIVCAFTGGIALLIGARFVQGLCIPAVTTCIAAYLSRVLPPHRLHAVMGGYVSATVAGGLGGRLLGGFVFPPEHWRYAFLVAATFLLLAVGAAARWLPSDPPAEHPTEGEGFITLLRRPDLARMFVVAFSGFFVFSAMFNYMPFYLSAPPLGASVRMITLLYLAYLVGVAAGPLSGKLARRLGSGGTLILGSLVFMAAIAATLVHSLPLIAASLAALCGGFFTLHAAAVGALNSRLTSSRGRANALYVLAYYLGGAAGISATGAVYALWGWPGAVTLGIAVLLVPLGIGLWELRKTGDTIRISVG